MTRSPLSASHMVERAVAFSEAGFSSPSHLSLLFTFLLEAIIIRGLNAAYSEVEKIRRSEISEELMVCFTVRV